MKSSVVYAAIGGFHAISTQITMVKWTNAGGQTKRANEQSFVYRPPAWRRWRVVLKTKHSKAKTEARSTQISKTNHPKLENEAPIENEAP